MIYLNLSHLFAAIGGKQLFKPIGLLGLLLFSSWRCAAQAHFQAPAGYVRDTLIEGKFNEDELTDYLVIYTNEHSLRGTMFDTCLNQKCRVFTGNADGTVKLFAEDDLLFPCALYHGRSDVQFDTLYLSNQSIIWRTVVAPFFNSVSETRTFTFRYANALKGFTLARYTTRLLASPSDETTCFFQLNESDLVPQTQPFRTMSFYAFSPRYVRISAQSSMKWEQLADFYQKIGQYSEARTVQEMILYFLPDRIVALRKIGDCYWEEGQTEAAQKVYTHYLSQADSRSVPDYIYDRLSP